MIELVHGYAHILKGYFYTNLVGTLISALANCARLHCSANLLSAEVISVGPRQRAHLDNEGPLVLRLGIR